jgi:hypothetical protein
VGVPGYWALYAGKVDHRFDKASDADLQKRLKPLIRTSPRVRRVGLDRRWMPGVPAGLDHGLSGEL